MNSRLLYILLAATTIASVLTANAVISLDSEVEQNEKIAEQALLENKRLLSELQSAEFQFSPVEKLQVSINEDSESKKQLTSTKQANRNQAERIALLLAENKKLQQKVTSQDQTIAMQAFYLEEHERSLLLAQQKSQPVVLSPEIERVKQTINQKPDMLNLKINPGPPIDEESPVGEPEPEPEPEIETNGEENKEDNDDKVGTGPTWDKLSGSVEFGFNYEQDNEKTKTLEGRLVLDYAERDKYNINSDLDFEFETEDGEDEEEEYRWQLQADYNLDPQNLVFVRSDLLRSEYASYKKEDIYTVGYGRILFNANNHKLNVEIGPGYRFSVPNLQEDEDAISFDEFIIRTRVNYERIMSETLQFQMDVVLEMGAQNSIYEATFKAQNRIYNSLYLVFDFGYKFTETVPADTVNKEVKSGMNLLYAF
ncbi:DUF481 domain-containing protein [Psychromonas ossibalaenae]|uniref:DUF481 domain-containing protein n=1 Tax=Psychromonas ossibalaenae TaxID=444922 RepID=UPI000370B76C|nr:DUF481 domain-containing protein [Psychromonas ossibalaenae]